MRKQLVSNFHEPVNQVDMRLRLLPVLIWLYLKYLLLVAVWLADSSARKLST